MAEQNRVARAPTAQSAALAGTLPNDAAMARAVSQTQEAQVSQPIAAGMKEANASDRALTNSDPGQAPQWQDKNAGAPAQEAQKAGQSLQDAGVTQNSAQAGQGQNQLDNSAGQAQNTSRCEAARTDAKSAAAAAPSQSTSMEK